MTILLEDKLKLLPAKPGVYLMKDDQGRVIYVGKALSLKNRVRSYFQSSRNLTPKTRALVAHIRDLDYIVTDSEVEALILECNLIKEHRPKYNITLKDDKHYPYIKVTLEEEFPRVIITRKPAKDGGKYFGPYTSAGAVKETLGLLRALFPLRTCKKRELDRQSRPCLNAHIGRCLAPCSGEVEPSRYRFLVREVVLFLEGKQEELVKKLEERMVQEAEALNFEEAARLRDQLQALKKVMEKQKIISASLEDLDVVALAQGEERACVQVFFIRGGKLIGREPYFLEGTEEGSPGEMLGAFLKQHYSRVDFIPREILLSQEVEEGAVIEEWLKGKRGGKVYLRVPKRGEKAQLVEMAAKNARMVMDEYNAGQERQRARTLGAVEELQRELGLENPPLRLEAYDIANLQGTHGVGSMVVFEKGLPANREYRRFRIKGVEGPNDFASMEEMLERRFRRAREELAAVAEGKLDPFRAKFARLPDLVIIDGGKGQLGVACRVMEGLGFGHIPVFGLAKEEEHLFRPGDPHPIILSRRSPALQLVQRLRDEAHRFANTYHRTLRGKGLTASVLDEIPGVGKARKKALLSHFRSLSRLREASVEEMGAVEGIGPELARQIYAYLHRDKPEA